MGGRNVFILKSVGALGILFCIINIWSVFRFQKLQNPATPQIRKKDYTEKLLKEHHVQEDKKSSPTRNTTDLKSSLMKKSANTMSTSLSIKDQYLKSKFTENHDKRNKNASLEYLPRIISRTNPVNDIPQFQGRDAIYPLLSPTNNSPPTQFSFGSMELPKSSINLTYAQNLIQFKLALEFENGTGLNEKQPTSRFPLQGFVDKSGFSPVKVNIGELHNADLLVGDYIAPNQARHILIATSWRSGSTFLGDLLNHYPGTFYSWEPLLYIASKHDKISMNMTESRKKDYVDQISQIFRCQPELGYFRYFQRKNNQFMFRYNFRLWNVCESLLRESAACFAPELYYSACSVFPIRLIKSVWLRVQETEKLLMNSEFRKTLKIVVLVRDPRGVLNSRLTKRWCKQPRCHDPMMVCEDLQSDVSAAFKLKKKYPGHIHLIRYEDLSLDPYVQTDRLLKFLDLSPNKLIEKFIEDHTETSRHSLKYRRNPYTTFRDSKTTAFLWKKTMKEEDVLNVQMACKEPMEMLGYNMMKNISRNKEDNEFPIIVKSSQDLWNTNI